MIPTVAVICNFLQWLMWVAVINLLLPRRYSAVVTFTSELLGFAVYSGLTSLLLMNLAPSLRLAFGLVFLIAFFSIFHTGRWFMRVCMVICLLLVALIADILSYYATAESIPTESIQTFGFSLASYMFNVLINAVLLSMLILAGWKLRLDYSWELSVPQMFLFALCPISQFVLLFRWYSVLWHRQDSVTVFRIILLVGFSLAADGALIYLIRSTAAHASLSAEVRYREEKEHSLHRYSESLLAEKKRMEIVEKEIDHMWRDMKETVRRGEIGALADRAESIEKKYLSTADMPECGNRIIAGFLVRRRELLGETGVKADFSAAVPLRTGIPDPDLICVFGNLLDNAEEACAQTLEPYVRLTADVRAPYLRIRVENSRSLRPANKDNRIAGLERGLGFQILTHMAEKYEGDFKCVSEGDVFISSLMIKGEF